MIVKKVPNPNKSASKAVRIRALAGYIRAPETESETEKCLYAGARGFLCDAPEAQTEEMLALARDAPRSRDPVVHWVLSWPEDEHPTPAQVEEMIDLLLEELDVAEHQVIYGLHVDTDNTHLHVMLNRVHPDTLRAVEINGGFDIKALHKACARIEHAQGWRAERGARYRVNAANEVEAIERAAPERMARPPQRRVDVEHRRGERSAARIAMEEAAPLIEAARSWEALHEALARRDMGYVRAGSGAAVRVGEVFVKASTVSRAASRKRLEARLGPYVAPPERDASRAAHRERDGGLPRAALSPMMDPQWARPLIEAAQSWEALHEALAAQGFRYVRKGSGALVVAGEGEAAVSVKASAVSRRAALRALDARLGAFEPPGGAHASPEEADPAEREAALDARHAVWARWEEACAEKARELAERQREERETLRRERCWKGRLVELNLHRHLLARAHASEKAALRQSQRRAREALREGGVQDKRLAQGTHDPALAFLRRTRHLEPGALEAVSDPAPAAEALAPRAIDDYQGRALGSWVVYATRAQHARGEVAFVDRGKRVTVHERDSDAAALAAMRLAAQKWGRFRARGSEAHKRRSAWLAAKHGLNLANPELQGLLAQYRRELGRDRSPPRLRKRPRAAIVPPPQGPLAAPELREPPQVAPPAPRVATEPGTPLPRAERDRRVLRTPPAAPRVEVALGPPPGTVQRTSAAPIPPPRTVVAESTLQAPAVLERRAAPLLRGVPAPPEAARTVRSPPRTREQPRTAPVGPPRAPRIEYELADAYGIDAALEAIALARRHESLEAQYGGLVTRIAPGVVTLVDQQDESRYTGAHTLSTAARAWACRLHATFYRLPEIEETVERLVWPELFATFDIDHRLIDHAALPDLAVGLRHAVHGQVTRHLSSDYRGEGDARSRDPLWDDLAESLQPRPRGGWGPRDIVASQRAQDRLDEDNVAPVRDSTSAYRVASAIAPVVAAIAQRRYGPEGKPPARPAAVPPAEQFPGWRRATREARHQTALAAHEAERKAREQVVSEALADWRAEAPALCERLATTVRDIENDYWHERKSRDEEEKRELLRQRRRQYNEIDAQRESVRDHASGRGYGC